MSNKATYFVCLICSVLLSICQHANASPKKVHSHWQSIKVPEGATKEPLQIFVLRSTNSFNLDFPYHGNQWLEIVIQKRPQGGSVFLSLINGQFAQHIMGTRVYLSFGKEPWSSFTGSNNNFENGPTTVFQPYAEFTSRMQEVDKIFVEAELIQNIGQNVFQTTVKVFEFNVSGCPLKFPLRAETVSKQKTNEKQMPCCPNDRSWESCAKNGYSETFRCLPINEKQN